MKNRLNWILLWTLFSPLMVSSQTDLALLSDLAKENKASVEALVLYPSETRKAILEATKYPEVLIKMQNMREKTSAAFRTLIEDFPVSTQTVFYDISRYQGLGELLVSQKSDPAGLRRALEVMPVDKQEETYGVVHRQMGTLVQINNLNQTTQRAFDGLIAGYPKVAQEAFDLLLALPEVIDLLNEDLRFTVLVGETYRDNPAWVIHNTDSLNLAVAREHAEELENWKATLEKDPAAKEELRSAAKEYAAENGYDLSEYEDDDLYSDGGNNHYDNDIAIHHYDEPYPYWYGYPWWEPYPRWRPYPWWYDWGCQFYPSGVRVVYLPSYYFTYWYFSNPRHHEHYNHLSSEFVNHYYGHRHSGTSISNGAREWHNRNRSIISDEFMADKGRLPERMKEYGKFESGRQAYNAKNPQKEVSQQQYLEKNTRKYPVIKQSSEAARTEIQKEDQVIQKKRSNWAPTKAPANPEPTPAKAPKEPSRVPNPNVKNPPNQQPVPTPKPDRAPPVTPRPTRQPATQPTPRTQPSEAKDYNQRKWEEQKPIQQIRPRAPMPTPSPKRTNPSPTRTTPSVPNNKGRGN